MRPVPISTSAYRTFLLDGQTNGAADLEPNAGEEA
jgi:hypothetical protein